MDWLTGALGLGSLLFGGGQTNTGAMSMEQLAQQLGIELESGSDPSTFLRNAEKLKKAVAEKRQQGTNAQNELMNVYNQYSDPNSKFYSDISGKLLSAQNQRTSSVGTLLGLGLASGVPYATASKMANQQRQAIEQQNRESVNNTMANVFLQGSQTGLSALGQFNQLQQQEANRLFQQNMYNQQTQNSYANQFMGIGAGLLGNALGGINSGKQTPAGWINASNAGTKATNAFNAWYNWGR